MFVASHEVSAKVKFKRSTTMKRFGGFRFEFGDDCGADADKLEIFDAVVETMVMLAHLAHTLTPPRSQLPPQDPTVAISNTSDMIGSVVARNALIYAFQLVDAVKPTNEKVLVSHSVTAFENDISGSLQILKQHVVGEISFQGARREDKGGATIVFEAHCVFLHGRELVIIQLPTKQPDLQSHRNVLRQIAAKDRIPLQLEEAIVSSDCLKYTANSRDKENHGSQAEELNWSKKTPEVNMSSPSSEFSAEGIIDLRTMSSNEVDPIQLLEKEVVTYVRFKF
ncbi:hypothetical protein V6N13_074513 [Hibiscus sabdariffa]